MATTYYFNNAAGGCTGSASGFDDTLHYTTAAGGEHNYDVTKSSTDVIVYRLTTPTPHPNLATWASGTYHCYIDVTFVESDLDIAAQFKRVLAGCALDQSLGTSAEADPPSVGINDLSISGAEDTNNASDRFQVDLLCDVPGHANQEITIDYNDSYVTTPWTASPPAGVGIPLAMHHYKMCRDQ